MLCILYLNSTSCCIEITETCKDMIYNYVIGLSSGVRRKFPMGAKVLSQLCDVTNQLGECRKNKNYRVVRGHALGKFRKIIPKSTFSYRSNRKLLENQKSVCICFEIQGEPRILTKNQLCFCQNCLVLLYSFSFLGSKGGHGTVASPSVRYWVYLTLLIIVDLMQWCKQS